MNKKILLFTSLILGCALLLGCNSRTDIEGTYIKVSKDDTVTYFIRESFDKEYYSVDELKQMIEEDAITFNSENKAEFIEVKKVQVVDRVTDVEILYHTTEAFALNNQITFFAGDPTEGGNLGLNLSRVFVNVDDQNDTMNRADLYAMEKVKILVTNVTEPVVLPGKVLYIAGENVELLNHNTVQNKENETYIAVYK